MSMTLGGFNGVKRATGPKKGSDSGPEARATNASFDRSPYQRIQSSLRGLPLRASTNQPSNKSGSTKVGC